MREHSVLFTMINYLSSFQSLLLKDNSVTIHIRNIQALAIELHKIVNGFSCDIMMQVIQLKSNHRYPTKRVFESRNTHSVSYGINSLAYLGPKIWDIVPQHFKEIVLTNSKRKLRNGVQPIVLANFVFNISRD